MIVDHFYHLYVDGQWDEIFKNHIENMITSNLINSINCFYLGIVGNEIEKQKAIKVIEEYNIHYEISNYTTIGWEQETLRSLYLSSINKEGITLYAHSKGSSSSEPIRHLWRNVLTHMTITHWDECIKFLGSYDTVGAFYSKGIFDPNPFYAGNFWWAKNEYLRTLGSPLNNNRWEAETWLLKGQAKAYDIKNKSSQPIQIYNGWLNNECGVCND